MVAKAERSRTNNNNNHNHNSNNINNNKFIQRIHYSKTDDENQLNAFEMRSFWKVLRVSWTARKQTVGWWRQPELRETCWNQWRWEKWHILGMSCEKMENVWRRSFKERLLGQEDVVDQRRPASTTSCHGPDLEWENCFRIPATGRRGVSSFRVRPTFGVTMVKEEEESTINKAQMYSMYQFE